MSVFFGIILLFAFLVIPFSYFWYEAYDPRGTRGRQCFDATKFTIGFVIVVVVLLVTGIFVKSSGSNGGDDKSFDDWVKHIFDTQNRGEATLLFSVFCLTFLGFITWITYTAYGIAAMPISMIRGKKSIDEEREEYENLMVQKKKLLRETENLEEGRRDAVVIRNQAKRLEHQAQTCLVKCRRCMRPFSIVFGIIYFLFSLLLVTSMFLGALDKTLNSYCGFKCGFFLKQAKLFNPIDRLLVILRPIYPLDFIFIACVILYFFFGTIKGLSQMGIRAFCLLLSRYKKRATPASGLLLGAFVLMITSLAINTQILTLAPQYAYWGGRTYHNTTDNTTHDCSVEFVNITKGCTMTQIGVIVSKMQLKGAFFGIVFYIFTWMFILCYLIGNVVACCRKKESNIIELSDDELEDEDFVRDVNSLRYTRSSRETETNPFSQWSR